MKPCAVLLCLLLLGASVRAGEDAPEAVVKDFLKKGKEIVTLLGTVKDKATAMAARPKLTEFDAALKKLMAMSAKADKEMAGLMKKYKAEVADVRGGIEQEMRRLDKIPEVERVLEDTLLFSVASKARLARARIGVRLLTTAVETYYVDVGAFPPSLDQLAEKTADGKGPYVKKNDLIDPWGRRYLYDPSGTQNGGTRPDIWSEGPPGESSIIGNWMKEKKE